jgi:hypothetical protein
MPMQNPAIEKDRTDATTYTSGPPPSTFSSSPLHENIKPNAKPQLLPISIGEETHKTKQNKSESEVAP